jgi:predicted DNA-binding protein (MmcQ/YjbR family)
LQRTDDSYVSDEELRDFLRASHTLVAAGLPRRTRQALDLPDPPAVKRRRPRV